MCCCLMCSPYIRNTVTIQMVETQQLVYDSPLRWYLTLPTLLPLTQTPVSFLCFIPLSKSLLADLMQINNGICEEFREKPR